MGEAWEDRRLADRVLLFASVKEESERQIAKWGVRTHLPAEWMSLVAEEAGELAKEINSVNWQTGAVQFDQRRRLYTEAIQLATLALKVAEMGGRPSGI